MMILVVNAGSSSVKYRLFEGDSAVAGGLVERIGEPGSGVPDHGTALHRIAGELDLRSLKLDAVGHRVVHGGTLFRSATVVDDRVLEDIRSLIPLAPLHNPANVAGIE